MVDIVASYIAGVQASTPAHIARARPRLPKPHRTESDSLSVKARLSRTPLHHFDTDARVVEAFGGIDAIPTTFIINRAGRIAGQHLGYTDQAECEKEIATEPAIAAPLMHGAHNGFNVSNATIPVNEILSGGLGLFTVERGDVQRHGVFKSARY
jgi:hypothetical protein